jgi:hypothetical protein
MTKQPHNAGLPIDSRFKPMLNTVKLQDLLTEMFHWELVEVFLLFTLRLLSFST